MSLHSKHTAQLLTAWHKASFIAFHMQRVTPLSWDYSKYLKVITAGQLEKLLSSGIRRCVTSQKNRAPYHVPQKFVIFRRPSPNITFDWYFETVRVKRRTHTARCTMKERSCVARIRLEICRLHVLKGGGGGVGGGGGGVRRVAYNSRPMCGGGKRISSIVETSRIRQKLLKSKWSHINDEEQQSRRHSTWKKCHWTEKLTAFTYNIKRKWENLAKEIELRLAESKKKTICKLIGHEQHG